MTIIHVDVHVHLHKATPKHNYIHVHVYVHSEQEYTCTCTMYNVQCSTTHNVRLTRGMTKGSLKPRLLAMVRTGLRHENMAAKRMIFPIRGFTGRLARW